MEQPNRIRISVKRITPNPLFETWLNEFIAAAERKDAKSQFQLKKALSSLQKYPLPLHTGRDCIILEGFGRGICTLLDKKLEEHIKGKLPAQTQPPNSIVELSDSFRASDVYQKVKNREREEISNAVLADLAKTQPAKPKKGRKRKEIVVPRFHSYEMHEYEIVLLVDTQETIGKSKAHLDRTILELNHYKVNYEVRRLSVGDFLWIARDSSGHELVLPYIVERKRKDDLAGSIKDGRFHEQKYRLKQCGLKNVIYLIENIGKDDQNLGLPIQNLLQAATNTVVQNGFQLKFTENNPHSVMYLHTVTTVLKKLYRGKTLFSCEKKDLNENESDKLMEFMEFNKASVKGKDPTVQEIFIKQLLLLKGLSVDKALAIAKVYPTPRNLLLSYRICATQREAENLLTDIQYGPMNRTIGAVISQIIYHLYTNKQPS